MCATFMDLCLTSSALPQDAQGAAALPDDPAKDMSYREAEIDQLRSQKDQVRVWVRR